MTPPTAARPRIAFYGGMANNCYVVASQLNKLGVEVLYIRDRLDNYAISQPIWEDHPLTLTYDELAATAGWTPADWDALAAREGWVAPDWVVDPLTYPHEVEPDPRHVLPGEDLAGYVPGEDHFRKVMALMRTCDLVFVSNVHAAIHALLSGKPYAICPAGGEFMIAGGLIKGEGVVGETLARQARIMTAAFHNARAVVTAARFLSFRPLTGGLWPLLKTYGRVPFRRMTLPMVIRPPRAPAEKRAAMNELMIRFGAAPVTTRFCVFIPSRIDYRWKGQDRILAALDMTNAADQFTFVFAGWGADYHDFVARTADRPNVRVLNHAMSKPLLFDLCQASDMVIDQFMLGHIGSAAYEAAAAGAPVMAWVEKGFLARLGLKPGMPVLEAKTPRQIAAWLDRINAGTMSLPRAAVAGQDWLRRHASAARAATILTEYAAGAKAKS